MRKCDWCGDDYDDQSAPANEFDPYCSSRCAANAEEDSVEDDYDNCEEEE